MKKIAGLIFLLTSVSYGQQKIHDHEVQGWVGYMTSVKLNNKVSLWNDFHLATSNFVIGRHGLSYHLSKQVVATGGYAWLFLAPSFSNNLIRREHRPWAQLMFTSSLGSGWQTQQRIRYDARYREKVENNTILHGSYTFNHRLRYMYNIRKALNSKDFGVNTIFLSVNNEVLLNFGKTITGNNLDQFRASLLVGRVHENLTVQFGYMYRFVPLGTANNYRHYHGITIWINHSFKTPKGTDDVIRSQ